MKGVFIEQFTSDWTDRWSPSHATKQTQEGAEQFSYVGQWAAEEPHMFKGMIGDKGLVVKNAAAHHAISAQFDTPLDNTGKTLVVQYPPLLSARLMIDMKSNSKTVLNVEVLTSNS